MTLCDTCQKLCKDYSPSNHTLTKCSGFVQKISPTEVDYMIRKLLQYYHIPETDEQADIVHKLLQKQANMTKVRDKVLSFLDKFKVNLS